jgi:hypothetical protein
MLRSCRQFGLVCLFALGLLGCSSAPRASISGQLLDKGQPLKIPTEGLPPGDRGIYVTFVALDASGTAGAPEAANVNPEDGTFTVRGKEGRGLQPGKYRITVARGAMGKANPADAAFGANNSPLQVEIPASATSAKIKVDVGTKQATLE